MLVKSIKTEASSNRMETVLVSWSGGKDCALAMYDVLVSGEYQVVGLLTTVTKDSDRVDLHDIRCSLIERQAQALGVPWEKVSTSSYASNSDYEPNLNSNLEEIQRIRRDLSDLWRHFSGGPKNLPDAKSRQAGDQGNFPPVEKR